MPPDESYEDVSNVDNKIEDAGSDDVTDVDETSEEAAEDSESHESEKYQVVVDGRKLEVSLDDLKEAFSLGLSSTDRYQKAAKIKKEVEPHLEMLKALESGDLSVLKGKIPEEKLFEFSEKMISDVLEDQQRSPEEKRAIKAERELEILRKEQAELKSRTQQQADEERIARESDAVDADIDQALSEYGLEGRDRFAIARRVVSDMLAHAERGQKVSAKQSLDRVTAKMDEEIETHMRKRFKDDPDGFLGKLSPEISDGVRRKSVSKVRGSSPAGKSQNISENQDDRVSNYIQREMRKAY